MSNFSKISKSVKKSLCVLASASSIFSILPTAMAMRGNGNYRFRLKQEEMREKLNKSIYENFLKDKPENFKKLVEYFNIHGTKCAEFFKNNSGNVNNLVLEKEKELGVGPRNMQSQELDGYRDKKLSIQKSIFDIYHMANCRIGTAAVLLKARELELTAYRIDLLECDENNTFIPNQHILHSFAVVELDGKDYLFDIVNEMSSYNHNSSIIGPMDMNTDKWIEIYSGMIYNDYGKKFTHVAINGEIHKKISYVNGKFRLEELKSNEIVNFN